MPIKWTPEIDQILLLKILETSQVNADVKAIAAAWPSNMEAPTPRAITERLVKIRSTAKTTGSASHFSVSNAKSPTSTPRSSRRKTVDAATIKKTTPTRKRRTKLEISDDSDTDDCPIEALSDSTDEKISSPSKKVKLAAQEI